MPEHDAGETARDNAQRKRPKHRHGESAHHYRGSIAPFIFAREEWEFVERSAPNAACCGAEDLSPIGGLLLLGRVSRSMVVRMMARSPSIET
jgi:hypothetical protein